MIRIPSWSIYLLATLALGSYLTAPISDPTFFFHLVVGQWIQESGAFPQTNLWTLLGFGEPWLATSWLFDLLLSVLENISGDWGLRCLAIVATHFSILSLSMLFLSLLRGQAMFAFFVSCVVSAACFESAEVSPEVLSWGLVGLVLLLLRSAVLGAPRFFGLFALGALLGNLHASFLLLPILPLFYSKQPLARRWLEFLILFFSGFVSPYFGAQLLQMVRSVLFEAQLAISFQDVVSHVFLFRFDFLLLLWITAAILLPRSGEKISRSVILFPGAFSLCSLAHQGLLPLGMIFTGVLVAELLALVETGAESPTPLEEGFHRLASALSKIPATGGIWLLFCLFLVNSVRSVRLPVIEVFLPQQAIDTILNHHLPGPLLHEKVIAPYVTYRFSRLQQARLLASFDDRLPLFSRSLATIERSTRSTQPGWGKLIHHIQPRLALCRRSGELCQLLEHSIEWKLFSPTQAETMIGDAVEVESVSNFRRGIVWDIYVKSPAPPRGASGSDSLPEAEKSERPHA